MKNIMRKCMLFLFAVVMICGFVTPVQAKTGNSAGNVLGQLPCSYGKSIYYCIHNNLYCFDTQTKKSKLVKTFKGSSLSSINVYNGKIYLTVNEFEGNAGYNEFIYSLNTNGSDLKKLAKGHNCHVADGKIYYIQSKTDPKNKYEDAYDVANIYRMKLNGTEKKKLRSAKYSWDLFVYGNRVYFQTPINGQNRLCSMKKDGSQFRTEVDGSQFLWIGADEGYLYYSGYNNIYRKKSNSDKSELVLSGISAARISGNNLYYLKGGGMNKTGTIYKKNLNTKKTSKIASGNGWSNCTPCGTWLYVFKYINPPQYVNGRYCNSQVIFMTSNGKYKKELQKYFLS